MSITNSILCSLNLKEENLIFDENFACKEFRRGVHATIFNATLSYTPLSCPHCASVNHNHSIIKYGFKTSYILINSISGCVAYLKLRKQRFFCSHCLRSFSAQSDIVNKNCFISNPVKLSISLHAKKKISEKDIAIQHHVSHATVNSLIHSIYNDFIFSKSSLPEHLSFDEFKSVKSSTHKMSFICIDSVSGEIINILQDRRLNSLRSYFLSYPLDVRRNVKSICMDIYSPYIVLAKSLFPHAKIVFDRFHIIQLLSRSLNKARVSAMKSHPKYYNKLKRYWKLILKDNRDLDDSTFKKFVCFDSLMREVDIVNFCIDCDPILFNTYHLYQDLLSAFKRKDHTLFFEILSRDHSLLHKSMSTSIKTLLEYKDYVTHAMTLPSSNGKIEGTNNLIKVIKRIAFGYRSFVQFKIRILLIGNTMVKLNNQKRSSHLTTP